MSSGSKSSGHTIVRLGMELALAVNDYNAKATDSVDEIVKLTLAYLEAVKKALAEGCIAAEEVDDYFALIGQSWSSVLPRFENEYVGGPGGPQTKNH